MERKRYYTLAEASEIINEWSDSDEEIVNVVCCPPETVDCVTDEEAIDDEEIPTVDPSALNEVAGCVELEWTSSKNDYAAPDARSSFVSQSSTSTSSTVLSSSPHEKVYKSLKEFGNPKWKRGSTIQYNRAPNHAPLNNTVTSLVTDLEHLSPLQLFEQFFDDEVIQHIHVETNRYGNDLNVQQVCSVAELKRFLGVLLISGYHTLPSIDDYWSTRPSLGVNIVKQALSRSKFKTIKRYLHLSNNNILDASDKFAKITPYFNLLNQKFIKFGVFSPHLSIDEQMIPYFGRHSCKMFMRGKPIRFGYKLWCLCSSDGYLYKFIPYIGSAGHYNKQIGLGADVVLRLLDVVENPNMHDVYFDNFFTSYYLMCLLSERDFLATGTIRINRLGGAVLKTKKKLPKGSTDHLFDETNQILLVRWSDNKEVTISTNHDFIEPMTNARRFNRKEKKYDLIPQANVIANYNRWMGGVDLHDNAVSNYRVAIRGKKWWWPLWISGLNSAVVNAWKLHCLIAKELKRKPMSQKDFKVELTEGLLLTTDLVPDSADTNKHARNTKRLTNIPRISGDHVIAKPNYGKPRRCQQCHKHTIFICQKCNVHLHTKCFQNYHEK